jgi:hypothetical protein
MILIIFFSQGCLTTIASAGSFVGESKPDRPKKEFKGQAGGIVSLSMLN